jgi:hypothetical protein
MRTPSRITRFFRLFIALLHFTVMGAAEIAEARYLQEEPLVAHIESESYECPIKVHSDHCAICQALLSTPDVEGVASILPFHVLERDGIPVGYQSPSPRSLPFDQGLPRAPPALLT